MRRIIVIAFGVVVTMSAWSWAQSALLSAADIEKFNASFAASWSKGDGEAVAGHYAQDAVRIGSSQETMNGRAAIQKYFVATLTGPSKGSRIVLRALETRTLSPGVAVVLGTFEVTGPGARSGRFLNTMVQKESVWLIASSGVVMDEPPPR